MTTATTTASIFDNAKAETYRRVASNGRHICMATKLVLADGWAIRFLEKLSKVEAIRQASKLIERGGDRVFA